MCTRKKLCCHATCKIVLQILVAGGTSDFCPNAKSPANNQSYLINVSCAAIDGTLTLPEWTSLHVIINVVNISQFLPHVCMQKAELQFV